MKSESANVPTPAERVLSLVAIAVGAVLLASLAMYVRNGAASDANAWTRALLRLIGAIGSVSVAALALGLVAIGVRAFTTPARVSTWPWMIGVLGAAIGLSFVLGAASSGSGGEVGALIVVALGALAGRLASFALGLILLLAALWVALRNRSHAPAEIPSDSSAIRDALTKKRADDGVTAAEATALGHKVVALPIASSRAAEVSDVRARGGIPAGTRPLTAEASAFTERPTSTPSLRPASASQSTHGSSFDARPHPTADVDSESQRPIALAPAARRTAEGNADAAQPARADLAAGQAERVRTGAGPGDSASLFAAERDTAERDALRRDTAGLDTVGLDTVGLDAAGLDAAGLDAVGRDTTDAVERVAAARFDDASDDEVGETTAVARVDDAADGAQETPTLAEDRAALAARARAARSSAAPVRAGETQADASDGSAAKTDAANPRWERISEAGALDVDAAAAPAVPHRPSWERSESQLVEDELAGAVEPASEAALTEVRELSHADATSGALGTPSSLQRARDTNDVTATTAATEADDASGADEGNEARREPSAANRAVVAPVEPIAAERAPESAPHLAAEQMVATARADDPSASERARDLAAVEPELAELSAQAAADPLDSDAALDLDADALELEPDSATHAVDAAPPRVEPVPTPAAVAVQQPTLFEIDEPDLDPVARADVAAEPVSIEPAPRVAQRDAQPSKTRAPSEAPAADAAETPSSSEAAARIDVDSPAPRSAVDASAADDTRTADSTEAPLEIAPAPRKTSSRRRVVVDPEPDVEIVPETPVSAASSDVEPAAARRELGSREALVRDCGLLFIDRQRVAVSMLQRQFEMDFKQATEMLDELQQLGLIGPYMGGTRRDILMGREAWLTAVERI